MIEINESHQGPSKPEEIIYALLFSHWKLSVSYDRFFCGLQEPCDH